MSVMDSKIRAGLRRRSAAPTADSVLADVALVAKDLDDEARVEFVDALIAAIREIAPENAE